MITNAFVVNCLIRLKFLLVCYVLVSVCPFIYRDIIIVIDNSATTVPDPDFEPIKTFLYDVVDHFNISSTRTRIGIIQYGGEPQVGINLQISASQLG